MASRKEQKERLKAERVAKEEAERRETARRRRMQIGAAAAAVVIVGVVIAVIAASGGGGGGDETTAGGPANDSVPAEVEAGLQDSPPPWKPDYEGLSDRISAMGLPEVGNETFHQHAWLHVYDDGKKVAVPANIGIDQATGTISPLHTHTVAPDNPEGIIHMEAAQEYDFTLGQFMAIWGVKFSDSQIGSLQSQGDQQLQVYLNGKRVNDPVDVVMPEHANIVIGYGKPGSFPTEPKLDWPAGL